VQSVSGDATKAGSPTEGGIKNLLIFGENLLDSPAKSQALVALDYTVHYGPFDNVEKYTAKCDTPSYDATTGGVQALECQTVAGVGTNYSLRVTVNGGKKSNIFPAGISYLPPVLESFKGAGVNSGTTEGGRSIILSGNNFGNKATLVSVVYGPRGVPRHKLYNATNCRINELHHQIECQTAPGVGKDLELSLYVAGQKSIQPSLSYGKPVVEGVESTDGIIQNQNADTEGNQLLVIKGQNFGPAKTNTAFKSNVRLSKSEGINEVVYYPKQCNITQSSTRIECFTPPGIGQDFKVGVSVEEQDSELGGGEPFGYGKPSISNVNLDVINTDGSAQISLSGENFGLNVKSGFGDPARSVYYKFVYASQNTLPPQLNDYTLLKGVSVSSTTLAFTAPPLNELPNGANVPSNTAIELVLGVTVQPLLGQMRMFDANGTKRIAYGSPKIDALSKVDSGNEGAIITLKGSNFGTSAVGALEVTDTISNTLVTPSIETWSHNEIRFKTIVVNGKVKLTVGKISPAEKAWSGGSVVFGTMVNSMKPDEPVIIPTNGLSRDLSNGGVFRILECKVNGPTKADVKVVFTSSSGDVECGINVANGCLIAINSSTTTDFLNAVHNITVVQAPPGQGKDIEVRFRYDSEDGSKSGTLSYEPPSITNIFVLKQATSDFVLLQNDIVPTQGGTIKIVGKNFGTSPTIRLRSVFGEEILLCTGVANGHTQINCTLPQGSGTGYSIDMTVGGQNLASFYADFGYSPPLITEIFPRSFNTSGGDTVKIRGSNLCTECSNSGSGSGPGIAGVRVYTCPQSVTTTNPFPSEALAKCNRTGQVTGTPSELQFQLESGTGKNRYVVVVNGNSPPAAAVPSPSTMYSYKEPEIVSITPMNGPTKGGADVSVYGYNFGPSTSQATVYWGTGGTGGNTKVVVPRSKHSHRKLSFPLPAGQGKNLHIRVEIGDGQDSQSKEVTGAGWFSYQAPSVTGVTPKTEYQACVLRPTFDPANKTSVLCGDHTSKNDCEQDNDCEWVQHYPTSGCLEENRESVSAWNRRLRQGDSDTARRCDAGKSSWVRLEGSNFGLSGLKVKLYKPGDSKRTELVIRTLNHDFVEVNVPVGKGSGYVFSVQAPGYDEQDVPSSMASFRYMPPNPTSISSLGSNSKIDALGNEQIFIHGEDFGGKVDVEADKLSVWINGKACIAPSWFPVASENGMPYISCTTEKEMLVGPLSMSLSIAGLIGYVSATPPINEQLTEVTTTVLRKLDIDVEEETLKNITKEFSIGVVNSICKRDSEINADGTSTVYHGAPGELCAPCPNGGICASDLFGDPQAKAGFYREKLDLRSSDTKDYRRVETVPGSCQPERSLLNSDYRKRHPSLKRRDYCYEISSCVPQEACAGFNTCAPGYTHTLDKCKAWEADENGGKRTKCTNHNDCRTRSGRKSGDSTCGPENPEDCARCVVSMEDQDQWINGTIAGYCECVPAPRCELCTVGTHHRLDNRCEECPGDPLLLIILIVVAILSFIVFSYWLHKRNFNLAFLNIGVDYFQVVALFTGANVRWPDSLRSLLLYMRVVNFNLDVMAPECVVPDFDYELKWWGTMLAPLFALGIITCVFLLAQVVNFCLQKSAGFKTILNTFISSFIVVFYYGYIILIKRGMEVFDCHERPDKQDGVQYAKFSSKRCGNGLCRCYDPAHLQDELVGPAIIFLCIYSIGFPLILLIFLRWNRVLIKQDQLLRAAETGNTLETNPDSFHIRKRYSQMYYHFRPGKIYWIIYILARKGFISIIGMLLGEYPSLQLTTTTLILFVAYVMQVKHEPYMSTSQRLHVLADHKMKCREGDEKHLYMAIRIKKALEFKSRQSEVKQKKRRRMSKIGQKIDKVVSGTYKHNYFFNFNSVEQTLLICAIVVCMAGVIFDTSLFANPRNAQDNMTKDVVGVFVAVVLGFSIVYYLLVFLTEVTDFSPKWLMKLCSDKKSHMQKVFETHAHRRDSELELEMKNLGKTKSELQMANSDKFNEHKMTKLANENETLKNMLAKQQEFTDQLRRQKRGNGPIKSRKQKQDSILKTDATANPLHATRSRAVSRGGRSVPRKTRKKKLEFKESAKNIRGDDRDSTRGRPDNSWI
jgi:hypothetical protein